MSCGCNKTKPITTSTYEQPHREEYVKRYSYFQDFSDVEKEVIAETLGFADKVVNIENYPDEEDLTSVMLANAKVLKFKDKKFDPINFSGMGRKFLRKNIVKVTNGDCENQYRNELTQEMFEDCEGRALTNTIFIIQYDYDLNEQFIKVPADSVLLFLGGSITNGNLILDNTAVYPSGLDITDTFGCYLKGTFKPGQIVLDAGILKYWNGESFVEIGKTAQVPNGSRVWDVYIGGKVDSTIHVEDMHKVQYINGQETPIFEVKETTSNHFTGIRILVPTAIKDSILVQFNNNLTKFTPNGTPVIINGLEYSEYTEDNFGLIQLKTLAQ